MTIPSMPNDFRNNIKLRYFRIIAILAATQSIRLTAEHLNVTPAAVSKACLELENIIGIKIFIRKNGCFIPNSVCKHFIETGQRIDFELKNLLSNISFHKENIIGDIKIGFQAVMLQNPILINISKIKKAHHSINLTLEYASRPYLLSRLKNNVYDFIFANVSDIQSDKKLKIQVLGREQYVVINNEKIYSIPDVLENWSEFSKKIWIIPVPGMAMRDRFDFILKAKNLSLPEQRIEINSSVGSENLVNLVNAFTLVPVSLLKERGLYPDVPLKFLPEMELDVGAICLRETKMTIPTQYVWDFMINNMKNI
ncbi:LysR family transcriptional regulator [Acetobacter sp. DmW_136]|uniref:LysR family transcriptional regulator n=1 Tax=Acetobacter sp. DmW_136 TaxID=2591091 RepID=UPI00123BA421|nr:LysR family transcriptional regulator [Acetobacter sp. DmW_136]KAA8388506.1 LysR family transcriptional regulator [Acetobacter sp. DmW_136]